MNALVRSRVWRTPVALGVLMSSSLIVALIGDGIWDMIACAALAGTLVYGIVKAVRRAA